VLLISLQVALLLIHSLRLTGALPSESDCGRICLFAKGEEEKVYQTVTKNTQYYTTVEFSFIVTNACTRGV